MKILIFFVDALPFEAMKVKRKFPTLSEKCLPLKSILGFSESIRASIFSGTVPSTHKNWGTFGFDPSGSSFNFLKSLTFLDYLPSSFLRRGLKFVISQTLCAKEARKRGYEQLTTRNMPYSLLSHFHYIPKYGISTAHSLDPIPTFFDILSSEGHHYLYLDWHKLGPLMFKKLRQEGLLSDVIVIYLDHLDMIAHRYGLWSEKYVEAIDEVVKIQKKILRIMNEIWGDYLHLTFSDHGMVSVNKYLSLNDVLRDPIFTNKDFMFIAGATYIRLWFQNEEIEADIINKLNKLPYGSLLSESEQCSMGVHFKQRRFFDELFLIKPGLLFFPNHYAWLKHKSMHGYDPYDSSQFGVFEIYGGQFHIKNINSLSVVDIMPTLLNIMELKVPTTCEGTSIIK